MRATFPYPARAVPASPPVFVQPLPPPTSPPASPSDSGLRRLGLTLGLCMLFVRVSFIHQLIAYETGVNTWLLSIIGVPILVVVLCTNVLKRAFRGTTGFGWLGFVAWIMIACVFS